MSRHIVFLESNPTSGLEAIRQACEVLKCSVTFITSDLSFYLRGQAMQDTLLRYADRILEVDDTGSLAALKETLDRLQNKKKIDAFLSFSEYHMVPSSDCAQYLGLRHASPRACRTARNKFLTRQLLENDAISQPAYHLVHSCAEAMAAMNQMTYPIIAKPVDGTASLNTRLVHNESELMAHVNLLLEQKSYGRTTHAAPVALLEEYVEGDIVSVETVTVHGKHHVLGITNRHLEGFPYFVEVAESFPVQIKEEKATIGLVLRALDSIGLDVGPAHTEVILSNEGPKILEINVRLAGGVIPQLIEMTTRRSILQDIVNVHLGNPVGFSPPSGVASAKFFYSKERAAPLKEVLWSESARDSRVKLLNFFKKNGDIISPVQSNFDRLGYVIAHAASQKEAENLTQRIVEETEIILETPKASVLSAVRPHDLLLQGVLVPTEGGAEKYDIGILGGKFSIMQKSSEKRGEIPAKKVVNFGDHRVTIRPSYVECHSHLALSPTIEPQHIPAHLLAAQYLYYGVTRIVDLFGFPHIANEWNVAKSESPWPFPEVIHCGHALTSDEKEGLYGHGHEFPLEPYYVRTTDDVDRALEKNLSLGASFIKLMYTEGKEVAADRPRFSILDKSLLGYVRRRLSDMNVAALVDTNTYNETLVAKNEGFVFFAHLMRDRVIQNAEWNTFKGCTFMSTLSALTPMVMNCGLFYQAFDNVQFHAAQLEGYFCDMDRRQESYGSQIGLQGSRELALQHLLRNAQSALEHGLLVPGSDSGNTFSFHGYGLQRELQLLQGDKPQLRPLILDASTRQSHHFFEQLSRNSSHVGIVVGAQADFNLFEHDPLEEGGSFFPWKTYVRGVEVQKERIAAAFDDYNNSMSQPKRKAGAL